MCAWGCDGGVDATVRGGGGGTLKQREATRGGQLLPPAPSGTHCGGALSAIRASARDGMVGDVFAGTSGVGFLNSYIYSLQLGGV